MHQLRTGLRKQLLTVAIANICASTLLAPAALAQGTTAPTAGNDDVTDTLPTVQVTGEFLRGASTENTGSYTSSRVTIGKREQSIKEIPQSVSVITRERMNDQGMTSLIDAMKYTTGIQTTRYGGNTAAFSSRGFDMGVLLLDGSPIEGFGYTDTSAFDTALFDRIEVLRGPTGILQGTGQPSGTINMVRKRAQDGFGFNASLMAGSWDTYRGVIDATGALNSDGSVRGRFVTVYDDRGSFIDHVEHQRSTGYGTLEFDVTENTTISLGAIYQSGEATPNLGLPAFADGRLLDVSRSTFLGSTIDERKERLERYFVELEHSLENGTTFNLSVNSLYRHTNNLQSSASNTFVDPSTGSVEVFPWRGIGTRKDRSLEASLHTPFQLLGQDSIVSFGASHRRNDSDSSHLWAEPQTLPRNAYTPDHSTPETDSHFIPTFSTEASDQQSSVYTQANLGVNERLSILLGGQLTWWETTPKHAPENGFKIDNEFTPYAGFIYDLTPDIAAYTSYTSIFQPQSNWDANGDILQPRTGDQVEFGVKGEHLNGQLNWHTAIFRINDENRAVNDPDTPGASLAAGKARSQGFEAEISGNLLPRWDISAGYAYTDTEFVRDPANEGLALSPETPKHSFNLWSRYRFSDTLNQGWRVGAGINAVSSTHARRGDIVWEQGGYTLLSAQVGYRFNESLDLSLNGNNLTDKKYYSRISGNTRNRYYGDPRNVMVTMQYNF
ncbi:MULTISPECIES: TonB-dependent siderophore receptor [unclassified Halomonas]|uniref:TonB-dependent siderophore receptor n=1 Tax=unclassified Halomonas TaxID=2609666 RepID=UPI0009908CBD|nr:MULTISPECIES: TonB-dependent siderophore receptor [unclassified Halomonas]AQU81378.1 TonB-dependent siderophore receptor [Halomonas sp. 'Soap Lake \